MVAEKYDNVLNDKFSTNEMTIKYKGGHNVDKLDLAVLDNGTVLDVGPLALVGGDMLGNGLVLLHALVSEEIYQPAEDSDHAQYGGLACDALWRACPALLWRLASGHAVVVFDMTRHSPHAVVGLVVDTVGTA